MCSLCAAAVVTDPNAYLVTLSSNGQGAHYLSANNNTYYVGINSNKELQVQPESGFDNVS